MKNVPPGSIMPKGFTGIGVEFDEGYMLKMRRLDTQCLSTRTGTQLKSSQFHN